MLDRIRQPRRPLGDVAGPHTDHQVAVGGQVAQGAGEVGGAIHRLDHPVAVSTDAFGQRSGVDALPRGQWDAGASLGLSYLQELRLVILPQAFAITRAPMVGFLVQLIKSTALTSIIGFEELLRTSNAINNATFEPFKVYGLVAAIFFALCYPLTQYARRLDQRSVGSR